MLKLGKEKSRTGRKSILNHMLGVKVCNGGKEPEKVGTSGREQDKGNAQNKILITVIRDWLGFAFTVAGFWLSLCGAVHIDIHCTCNIVVEAKNYYISESQEGVQSRNDCHMGTEDSSDDKLVEDGGNRIWYWNKWSYWDVEECFGGVQDYELLVKRKKKRWVSR